MKLPLTPNCCVEHGQKGDAFGYGCVRVGGRCVSMHRAIWEECHGPIPPGMVVRHKCDNPRCIMLDHMELGTRAQNTQDMVDRGRLKVGSALPQSKLTESKVRQIRRLVKKGGQKKQDIAARFGISPSTLSGIISGKHWRHA